MATTLQLAIFLASFNEFETQGNHQWWTQMFREVRPF